ncbi:MAG: hypothetical protein HRT90_00480 [Candidatus Margulisbacteria bacterium]|nr:hypothetical protein [Candidatus Margulisiibacteriota bacterium]
MVFGDQSSVYPLLQNNPKQITLPNGASGLLYLPQSHKFYKPYPLLIALHGMKQTPENTLEKWRPISDKLGYILLCPKGSEFNKGFIRTPTDDRKMILALREKVSNHFTIDYKRSIVAGYSRGGTFALELGLLYPQKFPNVISIFGFYNQKMNPIVSIQKESHAYINSRFFLITGRTDATYESAKGAHHALLKRDIKSKLRTYQQLTHSYPTDLIHTFHLIQEWMFASRFDT